jgi:hypothetical protein
MLNPEDWKRWILTPYFENKWRHLRLNDDDLRAMQITVMLAPNAAPVVAGTGGLRKIRFARPGSGRGKSGSYRIGYAYFEEYGTIVAIAVYAKADQANLTAGERADIRTLIRRFREWLAAERPRSRR